MTTSNSEQVVNRTLAEIKRNVEAIRKILAMMN